MHYFSYLFDKVLSWSSWPR